MAQLRRRPWSWIAAVAVLFTGLLAPPATAQPLAAPSAEPPVWRFTISAAVTRATADFYGGPDAVRQRVETQIDTVNKRFNEPAVFAGTFAFTVVHVYVFDGDPGTEVARPHPDQDYLVVFNGFPSSGGGWFGVYQAIHHAWPTGSDGGPFGDTATDALAHELGHARGAIDTYALGVNAANNPVSGEGYDPETSIMKYPYGIRVWDRHSVNIINRNATTANPPISYITHPFPSEFVVRVVNQNGSPIGAAEVQLHPVEWFSFTVSGPPVLRGTTGADGTLRLPSNPFGPDTPGRPWDIRYPNFLVQARAGPASATAWLPLTDVQNSYFSGGVALFTVELQVGEPLPSPTVVGAAFYTDGTSARSGPPGARVSVFATSSEPGFTYRLVSGRRGVTGRPCSADVVPLNDAPKFANAQGVIGQTTGPLNRPPGQWDVCFLAAGLVVTGAVPYTVIG